MTVELLNITKTYKKNRGVHNIEVTIDAGEITALVGANGAGKSTIIKLLTGQLVQNEGEIIGFSKEALRYMPDDLNFPDTLTAAEILALLANLKKVPSDKIPKLLEQVGLADKGHLRVSEYSKGMRQRLNLAQSLIGDGDLYILDEPTNGLDPFWIATLKKMLVDEKEKGTHVLFSTHLLSFAEEIADQVIMLHEGEVIAKGKISTLLTTYHCQTLEQLWLTLTSLENVQ
ncbi:ABC transporter ATP-binding protein [Solibacillus sp. FSL W8-0474]|uniref:ABC transporter ATP-binding protein n=1 Tax=Solibacillus sp. FSL W8-0474 TaxID=2975336 RepID=UPI0030FB7AF5